MKPMGLLSRTLFLFLASRAVAYPASPDRYTLFSPPFNLTSAGGASVGSPFTPSEKSPVYLKVNPQSWVVYPAGKIAHMWASDISSAWESPDKTFKVSLQFTDDLVPGSLTSLILDPGVELSTQTLGWVCMEALGTILHFYGPTAAEWAVPGYAVLTTSNKRVGDFLTGITATDAAGTNSTATTAGRDDSVAPFAVYERGLPSINTTEVVGQDQMSKIPGLRNEDPPAVNFDVDRTGRALGTNDIIWLLYTALKQIVWSEPLLRPVSEVFRKGQGHLIGPSETGATLLIRILEVEQDGHTVDFGYLEVLLKYLFVQTVVATRPGEFIATAYILNDSGQRIEFGYLQLSVVGGGRPSPADSFVHTGMETGNQTMITTL